MKKQLPIFIVIVILVGAGSFYGGMRYDQSKQLASRAGNFANRQGLGQGRGTGQQVNAGFTSGQIVSQDNNSLTLKLRDGGSKIIFTTGASISKTASGTPSDLTAGVEVTVIGTNNPDGSITAQNIQIGNNFLGGRIGAGSPSGAAGTGNASTGGAGSRGVGAGTGGPGGAGN